jgi:hypothetical protein
MSGNLLLALKVNLVKKYQLHMAKTKKILKNTLHPQNCVFDGSKPLQIATKDALP